MNEPADKLALFAAVNAELERMENAPDFHLVIGMLELGLMISGMQLALRHPMYPADSKRVLTELVGDMIDRAFADFPAHRELFHKGFDPRYDDKASPPPKPINLCAKPSGSACARCAPRPTATPLMRHLATSPSEAPWLRSSLSSSSCESHIALGAVGHRHGCRLETV